MSSSKLRNISKIVKEITMQSSQSRYDISGLDLSLCKFYYRTPQNLFKDLASGDYTIDTSSGQQSLVIQNDTVLQTGEAIQVCYNMDLTSSKYVVDFEIDINKLTTSYNELVEDVHTLWEYIRKTGMIADDTTIDLILPQLNNNEVWVKSEDGYRGMPLDDVESSIKDIIDKYSQQKIEEIKREVTTHVDSEIQRATNEITDVKDTSIQNIKDQEKTSTNNMISEINKHTEKKKVELNDHEQLKEQELNDLHEQLSTRLQELIDGAVMDKGVLPINSDWHLLDRGNYYVIDLFNSNYKNHPINIVNQNEGQGIVMVGIADDGKTKIIRYYSTSKRMFFQVLTQSNVWSEWAVVGGGNGTVYEIVQNNHGFNFNAVSLDGLTSRWVLADKNTGADAVAIKIDDNKFQLLLNGQGVIPTSSRDDKGNEFIYDEYYFLSNTVNGAFQKDKPTYGLFQPLFHTRMVENKLVADVQIGDIHDLTQHIVDSETIKEYGIATEKDLLNKLDKGNVSSNYDTAEKIEYQIKKLQANTIEDLIAMRFLKVGDIVEVLGYYSAGDGAGHKRIIANEDDGSGVQLKNRLWANIVYNGEVNVSWFGAKGDGITDDTQAIQKCLDYGLVTLIPNKTFISNNVVLKKTNAKIKGLGGLGGQFGNNMPTLISTVNNYALTMDGTQSSSYRSGHIVENIAIKSKDKVGNGIFLKHEAHFCLQKVLVTDTQKGVTFENTLIADINNLQITNCNIALFCNSKESSFSGMNNISFRNCIFINNEKVFTQNDFSKQFGHGVLFDSCEIETNGDNSYNFPCMEFSIGEATSESYGLKFVNCWIEGNQNNYNFKINSIGNSRTTIIFKDNVMFGLTTKSILLEGNNKAVKLVLENTSNYSSISKDSIHIKNGSTAILSNSIFSSKTVENGSKIYLANQVDEQGDMLIDNGLSIVDGVGGSAITIKKRSTNQNSLEIRAKADFYFYGGHFYVNNKEVGGAVSQLNTPYMAEKMKSEGVYNDFISYMDKKTLYDKQQEKLMQDRQLAYEEALKENPNLTYEEFMSVQPMTLNLVEEPQPSENLKRFMKKYL